MSTKELIHLLLIYCTARLMLRFTAYREESVNIVCCGVNLLSFSADKLLNISFLTIFSCTARLTNSLESM